MVLAVATGCETPLDAALLRVEGVAPDRIEPATEVCVAGRGFPAGRGGQVTFHGVVRRPGAPPARVQVSADARAASSERLVWTATEDLVEAMGGRGTFHGDVRVSFPASEGEGQVTGRLSDVELDFTLDASHRLRTELGNLRRGADTLERIGILPTGEDGADWGIGVDAVRPASAAALSGVAKGDRIVAMDGVRVAGVSDFVPAPGADTVVLGLSRPGEPAGFRVPVSLEGGDLVPAAPARWPAIVLGALFLLVLAFLAPTARLTARVGEALSRARTTSLSRHPAAGGLRHLTRWPVALARLGWWLVSLLAAVIALGVLPFTTRFTAGGVDVGLLLLLACGARLAVALGSDTTGGWRVLSRVPSAVGALLRDGLPELAAVVCIVLASGTVRLSGIVTAQGGVPWEWAVFRSPVAFLVFPAWVASIASLAPTREGPAATIGTLGAWDGGVPGVAARLHLFVACGLATALFLGGWQIPGVPGDPLAGPPPLRLLGAGLFVAKALGLRQLILRARRGGAGSARCWRWTAPLAMLALATALATLLWPLPGAWLGEVSGPILFGAATTVAIYLVARVRRRETPPHHLRLLP